MDRFFLGKLVDDLNRAVEEILTESLTNHLLFFIALDRQIEAGESHCKTLRYLFSLSKDCSSKLLLQIRFRLEQSLQHFNTSDHSCHLSFGFDDWTLEKADSFQFTLQFHLLEDAKYSSLNELLVAKLLDDTSAQNWPYPKWLTFPEEITRAQFEEELLSFCQHFISHDFGSLVQVRNFEAAFWRVVNTSCAYFGSTSYEALLEKLPTRYRNALVNLPDAWQTLRQKERAFSKSDFIKCSRSSLRLCQQLIALEG